MPLLPRLAHPLVCDGAPRGLGCVMWLVRPGTSPPRATATGVEKSSRLVG
jgi:hypothetical protein